MNAPADDLPELEPEPQPKKTGLWAWALGILGAGAILGVGYMSDRAKHDDRVSVTPDAKAEEFTPGVRRPKAELPKRPEAPKPKPAPFQPETAPIHTGAMTMQQQPAQPDPAQALADARRRSPLVVYGGEKSVQEPARIAQQRAPSIEDMLRLGEPRETPQRDANEAWMAEKMQASRVDVVHASPPRNNDYRIIEGTCANAILETAITSTLPGRVRAIVAEDIYGSSGRNILLPRMSRLVGSYNASLRTGQERVFVAWDRVRKWDGSYAQINSPGTDAIGRAGQSGDVDRHFLEKFGTAILLSVIGAGASTAGVDTADRDNSIAQYRSALSSAASRTAQSSLQGRDNIPPTINVPQGQQITVCFNRDLDFGEAIAAARSGEEAAVW